MPEIRASQTGHSDKPIANKSKNCVCVCVCVCGCVSLTKMVVCPQITIFLSSIPEVEYFRAFKETSLGRLNISCRRAPDQIRGYIIEHKIR